MSTDDTPPRSCSRGCWNGWLRVDRIRHLLPEGEAMNTGFIWRMMEIRERRGLRPLTARCDCDGYGSEDFGGDDERAHEDQ